MAKPMTKTPPPSAAPTGTSKSLLLSFVPESPVGDGDPVAVPVVVQEPTELLEVTPADEVCVGTAADVGMVVTAAEVAVGEGAVVGAIVELELAFWEGRLEC